MATVLPLRGHPRLLVTRALRHTELVHVGASICSRGITARPSQTGLSERRRKQMRPTDTFFAAPTTDGRDYRNGFVMQPTGVGFEGRTVETTEQRRRIQLSKSHTELRLELQRAIDSRRIDPSVFGAAMQRCGQGRWWDALLDVRQVQRWLGVRLFSAEGSIYLNALMRSVRSVSSEGPTPARQRRLVELGKEAWHEVGGATRIETPMLNAALRLCSAASEHAGLVWGEELWAWAQQRGVALNKISYASFALLLESHALSDRVDAMLSGPGMAAWTPDFVDLGALVNVAGELRNWRRADSLWRALVSEHSIVPHALAYCAYAKAHLLSGRPASAARIVEEMFALGAGDIRGALMHAQALLVIYHSSLAQDDLRRLDRVLHEGTLLIPEANAGVLTATWIDIKNVVECLRNSPSLRLHDVLVGLHLKRSKMAEWDNFSAGEQYL